MITMVGRYRRAIRDYTTSGQSMLEFALASTMLLLLVFGGVVDLGRAYITYVSLYDAAQEGAAYGSYAPTDVDGIKQRAIDALDWPIDQPGLTVDDVSVDVPGPACAGGTVTVTLNYTFHFIAPFIHGRTLALSASVTDLILSPAC
jgi:hypothetical protein